METNDTQSADSIANLVATLREIVEFIDRDNSPSIADNFIRMKASLAIEQATGEVA